jgi:hypothetical protein
MNKQPSNHLQKLSVFEGSWIIEGKNSKAAPDGSDQPVNGLDHYEWLDGNFFMINRWKHLFESGGHNGINILGFDEQEQKLFTRGFDNFGFDRKYLLEIDGRKCRFIGDKERAERIFSEDGRSYMERWELKTETGEWKELCIMNGTKK